MGMRWYTGDCLAVFDMKVCREWERYSPELHNRMYRQAGAAVQGRGFVIYFCMTLLRDFISLYLYWKGTNEYQG